MPNIAAKKIERLLQKKGIEVDGYNVIEYIKKSYEEVAKRLDMEDEITDEFNFSCEYPLEEETLLFYGSMCMDYQEISPTQELPYYYPYIESCTIKKVNGDEEVIGIEVWWR